MKIALRAVLFVVVALVASTVQAQTPRSGWELEKMIGSAGEDPVSSGITLSGWLLNGNQVFNITVQHEQGWLMYGRKFKVGRVKGTLTGVVGHFQGAPWAAPYLSMDAPLGTVAGQEISISTLQWPGVFLWEPKGSRDDGKPPNPESLYAVFLTSYQVNVGPVGFVYSWLNYLDEPWNRLPGVSFTQKIRHDFSVTASMTYNTNAKKWLPYIGGTWTPGS